MSAAPELPYIFVIFTEDFTGLLQRVVSVFGRRHINIESLTTSKSSDPEIHRFTIQVTVRRSMIEILTAQLNKQVDVVRAFAYEAHEVVQQEIALYKVPTAAFAQGDQVERLIRSHNARILTIEPEYVVLERTGHSYETEAFLEALQEIGVYEFVRSGTIAIVKPMERLNTYLKALRAEQT